MWNRLVALWDCVLTSWRGYSWDDDQVVLDDEGNIIEIHDR